MDKKELEKKLAELMDIVPECEGLIAADMNGKVIIGQTLTDMNHDSIAKSCSTIVKDSNNLGKDIGKGSLKTTTIELENGFAVLVGSNEHVLIALAGLDGKASLSLLKRNLMSISNS
ncbi:MAG: roadblock/LC7 domain-containing protein [Promethearchaeota archaeon]|jgi:predicted regulator of Ras-like GTPase activity (Roadblock/LC7/MglB family)|nr:MAG: roadblock/LC7 domain-containing protein [Candidatus Lokiarchaeota archaeon]